VWKEAHRPSHITASPLCTAISVQVLRTRKAQLLITRSRPILYHAWTFSISGWHSVQETLFTSKQVLVKASYVFVSIERCSFWIPSSRWAVTLGIMHSSVSTRVTSWMRLIACLKTEFEIEGWTVDQWPLPQGNFGILTLAAAIQHVL